MISTLLLTLLMMTTTEGYPVILDISTTSDWTELNFNNVEIYNMNDTILTDLSDTTKAWLSILSIRKKSYDSTPIHARFDVLLPKKLPSVIEFSIKKGAIGLTRVLFLTTRVETLVSYISDKHIKNYTIRDNVIKKVIPKTFKAYQKTLEIEPLVLAFYYPWYGNNWFARTKADSQVVTNKPSLGFYSSSDEQIMRKHIGMAKQAGIDGFIVSWWGKDSPTDSNLSRFLPIFESLGFKFTLYLEWVESKSALENDLSYLASAYARSPAFLRLNNQSVIFLFQRIFEQLSLDSLRAVSRDFSNKALPFSLISYGFSFSNLKDFAGFHQYLPEEKTRYRRAAEIARQENKLFAATVMPGYDDRNLRQPGNFTSREGGEFYKKNWEAILASKPDWVLITSFNEWFEGTEIEPSIEYGDYYLRLTARYARLFKKMKGY